MEFLSLYERWLTDSNIVTMTSLQSTHMKIASENGCESPDISRKKFNELIMEEIPNVEFCGTGANRALLHLNRAIKVAGSLVGLTLNENARVCFFLTAPRLKCPADEAKTMASVKTKSTEKHYLSAQITSRQVKYTESVISTFNNLTNPFCCEGVDLIKLLRKFVMEESIKEDMK